MVWKRRIQHLQRRVLSRLTQGSWTPKNIQTVAEHLATPCPAAFDNALFNFTIDFELIWGNGNLGGRDHPAERRRQAAQRQAENFGPFIDLLSELGFPISWAVLGKLADPLRTPPEVAQFKPRWATSDWYDPSYQQYHPDLWDGRAYLTRIRDQSPNPEFLSHGFHHIDYTDPATSRAVAHWDIEASVESLSSLGLDIAGFVYPCNKRAHEELLAAPGIRVIRGMTDQWRILLGRVETPIGFWISPAFFSFSEIKALLDLAIQNKSFFHPWMHLLECDLTQGDIHNFYRPLFEYVLNQEAQGKIQNVSFATIARELLPPHPVTKAAPIAGT